MNALNLATLAGLAFDRKLSNEELIRAIRFMVAAEYEASAAIYAVGGIY